jgi:aerobic-type carbon monoxide dehydrogenase small subunit (CoxS/CutS family)
MFLTGRNRVGRAAISLAATLLVGALCACGTVNRIRGTEGASTEQAARQMAPQDPMARPIQVAWTSARASHCGFIFDPGQLRANYLAAEAQAGKTPAEMAKIERAYDYTRESVTDQIKGDLSYCTKERTAAIRRDLNRYLAGDYTPSARMGQ